MAHHCWTEALHFLARLGVPDLPEVDLGVWEYMLLNTYAVSR